MVIKIIILQIISNGAQIPKIKDTEQMFLEKEIPEKKIQCMECPERIRQYIKALYISMIQKEILYQSMKEVEMRLES